MSIRLFFAHVAMFFVALIYAANFSLAKMAMPDYVGAFGFILLRVSAAAALVFISSSFIREKVEKKDIGTLVLTSIFGVALNMLTFFKGLELTTPINGALIMLMTPILVLVFSFVVLKEKLNFLKIIGIGLGLGGALMLTLSNSNAATAYAPNPLWGNILVGINAASYGIYLIMVKPLAKKYHPITIMKWNFGLGLLFVFPFGIQETLQVNWQSMPYEIILVIAFVLFFVTFVNYLLNAIALTMVSPAVIGAYIYLQPVLTALIAVIGGHDNLTLTITISSLLIFGGVYLVSYKK
jgi:drug/metabolite transporter (DMT)-like permease